MSRTLTTLLLALALFPTAALAGEVKVHILDATVKDKVIAGVEVILQKNGETSLTSKTDARGDVSFDNPFQGADDKSVTLIAKKDGYSNLVVRCPVQCIAFSMGASTAWPNLAYRTVSSPDRTSTGRRECSNARFTW